MKKRMKSQGETHFSTETSKNSGYIAVCPEDIFCTKVSLYIYQM